jgi:hypothetical protein
MPAASPGLADMADPQEVPNLTGEVGPVVASAGWKALPCLLDGHARPARSDQPARSDHPGRPERNLAACGVLRDQLGRPDQ